MVVNSEIPVSEGFSGEEVHFGSGKCCGSFGELLQGILPDGQRFLVHLKITESSSVRIKLYDKKYKNYTLRHGDDDFWKSRIVIKNILESLGLNYDFNLRVRSDLPRGKGLSSSTADMVASIHSLEDALHCKFSDDEISRHVSRVEPNDGLHLKGSVVYNYVSGDVLFRNEFIPHLKIIGIDTGGFVDTIEFNKKNINIKQLEKEEYANLLRELKVSIEKKDIQGICNLATRSAVLWQKVLPKPEFNKILDFSKSMGSAGLINCHSGTFTGIAFEAKSDVDSAFSEVKKMFPEYDVRLFETQG